jgi:hypothetical protein
LLPRLLPPRTILPWFVAALPQMRQGEQGTSHATVTS